MALIVSAATGNFNAGATWVGGVVPTVGDEARAATGHTITITANATCDEVSNAGTGIFTLNDGVTLTANVASKSTTTSRNCLQFTAASPAVGTIVGNCTGGTVSGAVAVAFTSTGTLTITGNLLGGTAASAHACTVSSTGTLNLTGNTTGGSVGANFTYGINGTGNANINITGNAVGGTGTGGVGILSGNSTNFLTITGNATGGSATSAAGVFHNSTGLVTITGIATGGTLGGSGVNTGAGVQNNTTGTVIVKRAVGNAFGPGNTAGLAATTGAHNNTTGIIEIEELEFGQYGMNPTSGTGIRLKKVSTNQAIFTYVDAGSAKTLVDATTGQMPATTDVRFGTSYASGNLTGRLTVPARGSVSLNVNYGPSMPFTATRSGTTATATLTYSYPLVVGDTITVTGASSSEWNRSYTIASVVSGTSVTFTVPDTHSATAGAGATMQTTGTAVLDPAAVASAVWGAATRTITGGLVDTATTLTNAPASVTPSDIWSHAARTLTSASGPSATDIRQELDTNSTKLANLDATVSSRLASSVSTNITAIKAKTDLLNTDRLAQCATTSIVGNLIAQSNS